MNKKNFANFAVTFLIGALVVFALVNMSSALTPKGLLVREPVPGTDAAPLLDMVSLQDFSLSEDNDHSVQAKFIVQNSSKQDIKNIQVQCELYEADDSYIGQTKWILPGMVEAGQSWSYSKTDRRFINLAASNVEHCKIVDFQIAKGQFFTLQRSEKAHAEFHAKGNHTGNTTGSGADPHGNAH